MNKKTNEFDLSRRKFLKFAFPGLLAGIVVPSLIHASPAGAATGTENNKVLVVYYSRTGNTRTMASYVHDMVGGDLVRIQTVDPYPEEYRATTDQAKKEMESGYKPPLTTRIDDMASYGTVFVGSPCWWGTICTPMISFLSEYDFSGKTLVPFLTHKGGGLGRTMAHVRELCPGATVLQGKAIWGDEIDSSREEVAEWLRGIGMV